MKGCSIEGCSGRHEGRGWCQAHYLRWWKYGDPLGGGKAHKYNYGARAFFETEVLNYRGEDCLIWPFKRDSSGYAVLGNAKATRLACEHVNGPPPTSKHQAAHLCGKGKQGCCAPMHLSWKTPLENAADKILHGTVLRGEKAVQAKLTEEKVRAIRALAGVPRRVVAQQFGVSQTLIFAIQRRTAWAHVD